MTRNVRTYEHFCLVFWLVARALERVGDRWSLLVIRDLLTGLPSSGAGWPTKD